jgi:hypothetical protein
VAVADPGLVIIDAAVIIIASVKIVADITMELFLILLRICIHPYDRSPMTYAFSPIVPQCSTTCEPYMIELKALSTLTARPSDK